MLVDWISLHIIARHPIIHDGSQLVTLIRETRAPRTPLVTLVHALNSRSTRTCSLRTRAPLVTLIRETRPPRAPFVTLLHETRVLRISLVTLIRETRAQVMKRISITYCVRCKLGTSRIIVHDHRSMAQE